MSDKNVRHVRLIVDEKLKYNLKNDDRSESNSSDMSDKTSDNVTQSVLDSLRAEMAVKDEQIARLIEAQREMTATLQKLQEQMFELARLVLSQNAASGTSSVAQSAATRQAEPGATQSRLWGFLRRSDNKIEGK
jgi:hypothetical protein